MTKEEEVGDDREDVGVGEGHVPSLPPVPPCLGTNNIYIYCSKISSVLYRLLLVSQLNINLR